MTKTNNHHNFSFGRNCHSKDNDELPSMIVFDLDDCLWTPEMHELYNAPTLKIKGKLDPKNEEEVGTVGMGVPKVGQIVKLYQGARLALRELALDPKYKGITIAVASSSLEPSYSRMCLEGIEILPNLTMNDMISYSQIGRSGKLTPRKTTHFKELHEESGIPYDEMLFFDDCNWGDHCSDVTNTLGVVSKKTPRGLQLDEFHSGLEKYKKMQSMK